ncbi:GNAT family N-acetyltransferase [Halorussus salinisoli]|uniref:GNAT family N-acetyltransferase n=1 Tax=Halorussus salinisoli TaxID=2558242 RepID=UPI0010C240B8|nr:GNAT family N-acetyltransferase [Halorussus salinisoli]
MTGRSTVLTAVESDRERSALRELLREFHEWMAEHAGDAYDPDDELAEDFGSLDGETESWAWIARTERDPSGCVLLYGETDELAEFRRLYVRPAYRGEGVGRRLVRTAIDRARARGYETLGLTTPPWSEAAAALYESMGFERTPPYPETRLRERYHDEAIFMQLDLSESESDATDT